MAKLPKKKKLKKKTEIVWVWKDRGWIARIIEDEDGGGWAITMTRKGDDEPAYMGPWTMGRNKVDPKPLDQDAFNTWVKSATEFLARSQYQQRTANREVFTVFTEAGEELTVEFDIEQGDYEAEGMLIAKDVFGNEIERCTVDPRFKLTLEGAEEFGLPDGRGLLPPAAPGAVRLQARWPRREAVRSNALPSVSKTSIES